MGESWNPYLIEWLELHGSHFNWRDPRSWGRDQDWATSFGRRHAWRRILIAKYAFAVPSCQALEAILKLGPIVEMGAGTGYWARCLRERGADVVAYDELGEDWHHFFRPRRLMDMPESVKWLVDEEDPNAAEPVLWTEVLKGSPPDLAKHADRALLLCWPTYANSFGVDCLRAYAGSCVVYVGEGEGGCTGDDEFHHILDHEWIEEADLSIPQWEGLNDRLWIYRRRYPWSTTTS